MTEGPRMRLTQATQLVLRALLANPADASYCAEIGREAGLPSGTVTPILARLENLGILESTVEEVPPSQLGRPRRKYYNFTPDGAERARLELDRARARATGPAFSPSPNPGWAG